MRVNLFIPRLPLPFAGSDSRWFHVLASRLPRLDVDLVVVAIHEGQSSAVIEALAHAAHWGYALRVVQPTFFQGGVSRLHRIARPRTELAQSDEVCASLRALRDEGGPVIFSGISTPGLTRQIDAVVAEVHYLKAVDQRGEPRPSPVSMFRQLQDRRAEDSFFKKSPPLIVNSRRMAQLVSKWRAPTATTKLTIDPFLYGLRKEPAGLTIGFIGSMFWEPSRRAAERLLLRVWPLIRAQIPGAQLLVAGWHAQERLGPLFPIAGAELVPAVAQPADFFERLTVLLFPPVGGTGMKIKTLEAMAYGVPVVTTGEGTEGLEDVKGAPKGVVDDDQAIADAAVALLSDWRLRSQVSEAGLTAFERDLEPTRTAEVFLEAALKAVSPGEG